MNRRVINLICHVVDCQRMLEYDLAKRYEARICRGKSLFSRLGTGSKYVGGKEIL